MADSGNDLNALLAPRFLFRFAAPMRHHDPIWKPSGVSLDASYCLPDLAALDAETPIAERQFADVRMAWHAQGLLVTVAVAGKSQPLWCRDSRLDDSDGLQLWIDTRATHNIHRASKYCHRFVFLPAGGGKQGSEPLADQLLINRARENARPVRPRELQMVSTVRKDGYHLAAFLPAVVLGGYDPEQHKRIGFTYAVYDRELGIQTFAAGVGFPYDEDPSCWATLELVNA